MGFLKLSPNGAAMVDQLLVEILARPGNRKAGIPQLLQELLSRDYPIRVLYTVGHWLDINSLDDVVQAGNF
jgi:phosphoenolpyruvate phosphomutase